MFSPMRVVVPVSPAERWPPARGAAEQFLDAPCWKPALRVRVGADAVQAGRVSRAAAVLRVVRQNVGIVPHAAAALHDDFQIEAGVLHGPAGAALPGARVWQARRRRLADDATAPTRCR